MANLYVPPEAPLILHAGAAALLYLHIGGASLGMASGTVAILARKGRRIHRAAGTVFFVSMLVMTAVAAGVAPFLDEGQWVNTGAAVFTFYLVATAWATVRRKPGEAGLFEKLALVAPVSLAVVGIGLAVAYAGTPRASAFSPFFAFAALSALAAVLDVRMILRGGVTGWRRIARHLWRMSAALAIALGSFFVGQQTFLPEAVQGSPWLGAPMLAVLAVMFFWLARPPVLAAWRKLAAALRNSRGGGGSATVPVS